MILYKLANTYSFDFDDTLTQPVWDEEEEMWGNHGEARQETLDMMLELASKGHTIIIVTARREEHLDEVREFVKYHQLPVAEIHATNHALKGHWFKDNGIEVIKHFDDCPYELMSLDDHGISNERVWHPFDLESGYEAD